VCSLNDLIDPYASWLTPLSDSHIGGVLVASHSSIMHVKGKARKQISLLSRDVTLAASPMPVGAGVDESARMSVSSDESEFVAGSVSAGCWLDAAHLLLGDTEGMCDSL